MFLSPGYPGGARARYQNVDLTSQVEGASPHKLIAILFDELIKSIDTMMAAHRMGNRARMIEKQARAANVLIALETSLDYQNGGELAVHLAQVYRESRRLVQHGGRAGDMEPVAQARAMIAELSTAWEQIG
ncbi:flagellar protein FliS [Sphingomonas sp. YR710]|jgi:flagellar protein FliS|uniref:flagellar export chaperone FliS n=1 Tax=Sphingomonas sp. YR710 TaxID=1882773 RepID=UPI00088B1D51|nr:flagellar protein FliS [Sphingomonas sp. YR710]SDC96252.1 flagellar protein FliS [Sphingomonas sp. YR710]